MSFSPQVLQAINQAATRYGIEPETLIKIAKIESGGNPNARNPNPNSSAGGLFQFVDSTASRYGLQNKYDPYQASDAAARLTRDNANILAKGLGRMPTASELYLAHQQGPQGAINLLKNPDAKASDIVGARAVTSNGGNQNMTAANFANMWANRMVNNNQQPVLGSLAPMGQLSAQPEQNPQPNLVDAYSQFKAGDTKAGIATAGNALSNAFNALGGQPAPEIRPMQLAPVQGPSAEQSTALAKLLETMKPKFNSGGTL